MENNKQDIALNTELEKALLKKWFVEPGDEEYRKMYEELSAPTQKQLDHLISTAKRIGKQAIGSQICNPKDRKTGVVVVANQRLNIKPVAIIIGDEQAVTPDEVFNNLTTKYSLYALAKLFFMEGTPWADSGSNLPELMKDGKIWSINNVPIPPGGLHNEISGWKVATSVFPPKVDEAVSLCIMEEARIVTPDYAYRWAKRLENNEFAMIPR